MKRYFKVISPTIDRETERNKRCRNEYKGLKSEPLRFVSWNVNGLLPRTKGVEWQDFVQYIKRIDPDIICLQEVRLRARNIGNRNVPDRGTGLKSAGDILRVQKCLSQLGEYNIYHSLSTKKYAGTSMLVHKRLVQPIIKYSFEDDEAAASHHPDGRVILASFASLDVLTTYSPNHGSKNESFVRREQWDKACLKFFKDRARDIVWIGDLNVAHEIHDVTAPYNWWEKQCYQGLVQECRGQPGFSKAERSRFTTILQQGKLIDTYRHKYQAINPSDTNGSFWTWRGAAGIRKPDEGKYYGRAMRIDYALISRPLLPRLEASEIIGRGHSRENFFGSDHCPIELRLKSACNEH